MAERLFEQNIVACIWDFDKTLSPNYMQRPLFEAFGINESQFWQEVRALSQAYRDQGLQHVADDTCYLNHMLTYAKAGPLAGLSNAKLRDLGAQIELFAGLPQAFAQLKQLVSSKFPDIRCEHYVVSNGLAEMIRGSAIADQVDGIWGCEFVEFPPQPGFLDAGASEQAGPAEPCIQQIAYAIDNTTKTRAIFEINKGSNAHREIGVNDAMARANRRIPFENMVYIAGGPSDIPVFSLIRQNKGQACAVYTPGDRDSFTKANGLLQQNRVDIIGPADYSENSQTWFWLSDAVLQIAHNIREKQTQRVKASISKPPESY